MTATPTTSAPAALEGIDRRQHRAACGGSVFDGENPPSRYVWSLDSSLQTMLLLTFSDDKGIKVSRLR